MPPEETVKAKKKDGDDALRKKQYDLAIRCYTEALSIDRRNDLIYLHRRWVESDAWDAICFDLYT